MYTRKERLLCIRLAVIVRRLEEVEEREWERVYMALSGTSLGTVVGTVVGIVR